MITNQDKVKAAADNNNYGLLNQINSTDEDEQDEDDGMNDDEDENDLDSMMSENSSFKHQKSKAIKKKIGGGFSKSPKLLPSQAPMNDLPDYYMISGAVAKDGKKAKF
jgi:hypothetical protein